MRPRPPKVPDLNEFGQRFEAHALSVASAEIQRFAQSQVDEFKRVIYQDVTRAFGGPPLASSTVAAKESHDLAYPNVPLVATQNYVRSLQVINIATYDRNRVRFVISHPLDAVTRWYDNSPRPDVSLQFVARIHEYGCPAANIPARPHWNPFFTQHLLPSATQLSGKIASLVVATWRPR